MAKVKNINGTSKNNCNCGSWLQHWKNYSGQNAEYCSEKLCLEKAELVGAHVQKSDSKDMSWFIIPLCKTHNKSTGDIEIMDSRKLVSANIKETCNK